MKKLLSIISAIALFASCSNDTFTVKGTIDPSMLERGDFVIMVDNVSQQTDTAQISGGKFTFSGPASIKRSKSVMIVSGGEPDNSGAIMFIPEPGTIKVDFGTGKVKGGEMNQAFSEFNDEMLEIIEDYSGKVQNLIEILDDEEIDGAVEEIANDAQARLSKLYSDTYNANKDNILGLLALSEMIYDFESIEDFDNTMEGAADFILNYEPVATVRASLEKRSETAEGKMFANFTGENAKGKPVSLSDYVGKGKWVLVDFWASWCVPCMEEIPNIIDVYDKYAGRNFTVIGVPISDERDDTDRAINKLGIKYDQIFIGDDQTAADVYGITTIPHLILFAPDGTVAKRNLRGDSIEEAVKEALQK
jgi:thiol-disulfide isomerase/thioredoxin